MHYCAVGVVGKVELDGEIEAVAILRDVVGV